MQKKGRASNIELLRVVAMFLIIIYHIVYHTVGQQLSDPESVRFMHNGVFNYPFFYPQLLIPEAIMPLGIVGNVIFILISGYFMIEKGKEIALGPVAKKLLLQLGFAAVLLVIGTPLVYLLMGSRLIRMVGITRFNGMSWFVGYYFLVIVIAALFLNQFLRKLPKKTYITFLLIIFGIMEFGWSSDLLEDLASGLEVLIGGVFFYSLGAFIRLYDPFGKLRTWVFPTLIAATYILILISSFNKTQTEADLYSLADSEDPFYHTLTVYSNTSIVVVIIGVCVFELFRRISIPENRGINYLGKCTFMIYLIHDNRFFYSLWGLTDWMTELGTRPGMFVSDLLKWALYTFGIGVAAYSLYRLMGLWFHSVRSFFLKIKQEQ